MPLQGAARGQRWRNLRGGTFLTGGVVGPVLFSSFERHLPLARVLDKIGTVFGPVLEANGIQWDAITNTSTRKDLALQVLRKIPVLWIWDNVEPITGFPAGTKSNWSDEEEQELRAFLRDARDTKAKFLLTSRRDEEDGSVSCPSVSSYPQCPCKSAWSLRELMSSDAANDFLICPT